MGIDDELPKESTEVGSDELLSDDNLRLPESANTLVRLHAIRAWLTCRQRETSIEIGEMALSLQQLLQEGAQETCFRRRERQSTARLQQAQQLLQEAQQRLNAYEEAEALLEDCLAHTTTGERALVEYYPTLDELVHNSIGTAGAKPAPWYEALADVQQRIERVSAPSEQ